MKTYELIVGLLIVPLLTIILYSSFSKHYDQNAFARVCYEYVGVIPATAASLAADASWQLLSPTPTEEQNNQFCPGRSQPCAICFYDNAGGGFTKSQAISLVTNYINSNSNFIALADPGIIVDINNPQKIVTLFQFLP